MRANMLYALRVLIALILRSEEANPTFLVISPVFWKAVRVKTSEKRWVTLRLFWQVHRYVLGTIIAVGTVLELPAQPNLQELRSEYLTTLCFSHSDRPRGFARQPSSRMLQKRWVSLNHNRLPRKLYITNRLQITASVPPSSLYPTYTNLTQPA